MTHVTSITVLFKTLLRLPYGLYAWLAFLLVVCVSILVAVLVPGLQRRRRWIAAAGRGFFLFAGIRATVRGLDELPPGHCVVVANHASYLDGVILHAYLPPRFSYVVKGEMRGVPLAHFLLRRIGARFVERFVTSGSARDARSLLRAAAAGESLAFSLKALLSRKPASAVSVTAPLPPPSRVNCRWCRWRFSDPVTYWLRGSCCHGAGRSGSRSWRHSSRTMRRSPAPPNWPGPCGTVS